eukprot:g1812.t1
MKDRFDLFDVTTMAISLSSQLGRRVNNIYDLEDSRQSQKGNISGHRNNRQSTSVMKRTRSFLFKLQKSGEPKTFLLIESGIRFHLSRYDRARDKNILPNPFTAKLRRHLRGRRLSSIRPLFPGDRVVEFVFSEPLLQFQEGYHEYFIKKMQSRRIRFLKKQFNRKDIKGKAPTSTLDGAVSILGHDQDDGDNANDDKQETYDLDYDYSPHIFRLIIEVYDRGNVILCDDDYRIIATLRNRELSSTTTTIPGRGANAKPKTSGTEESQNKSKLKTNKKSSTSMKRDGTTEKMNDGDRVAVHHRYESPQYISQKNENPNFIESMSLNEDEDDY